MGLHWVLRPLPYKWLFLITRPPPLETSTSQTNLIIHVSWMHSQTGVGGRGEVHVRCLLHTTVLVVYWVSGPVQFIHVRREKCLFYWFPHFLQYESRRGRRFYLRHYGNRVRSSQMDKLAICQEVWYISSSLLVYLLFSQHSTRWWLWIDNLLSWQNMYQRKLL